MADLISTLRAGFNRQNRPKPIDPKQPDYQRTIAIKDNFEWLWNRIIELTQDLNSVNGDIDDNNREVNRIDNNVTNIDNSVTNIINNINTSERFYGYNVGGGENIGSVLKDLVLTTEFRKDSPYIFTVGDAEIEINETDKYEIVVNAGFDLNEGDIIEVRISVDDGTGYHFVDGAFAYCGA